MESAMHQLVTEYRLPLCGRWVAHGVGRLVRLFGAIFSVNGRFFAGPMGDMFPPSPKDCWIWTSMSSPAKGWSAR